MNNRFVPHVFSKNGPSIVTKSCILMYSHLHYLHSESTCHIHTDSIGRIQIKIPLLAQNLQISQPSLTNGRKLSHNLILLNIMDSYTVIFLKYIGYRNMKIIKFENIWNFVKRKSVLSDIFRVNVFCCSRSVLIVI